MLGSAPSGHRDLVGLYLNLCSFPHDNLCRFSTNRSSKTTQMFYLMDTGSRVRSQYIENQTRCRCEDHPDVTHVRDAGRRGPGRVHQGPGQEVLHKPGGILEGARIKPDDTVLSPVKRGTPAVIAKWQKGMLRRVWTWTWTGRGLGGSDAGTRRTRSGLGSAQYCQQMTGAAVQSC